MKCQKKIAWAFSRTLYSLSCQNFGILNIYFKEELTINYKKNYYQLEKSNFKSRIVLPVGICNSFKNFVLLKNVDIFVV